MSVIAWDGKIVAADRLSTDGYIDDEARKLFDVNPDDLDSEIIAIGITGCISEGLALKNWFLSDPHNLKGNYPSFQTKDNFSRMVVFCKDKIKEFEHHQTPIVYSGYKLKEPRAWGSGREVALGAMHAGKNAREAVEICNKICSGCGLGVDSLEIIKWKT